MSEMSMVERVARAIYEKRNGAGCKPWSIQTKAHKAPYLDDARAAIEAMRVPTPAMSACGRDTIEPYVKKGLSKPVNDQWQIGNETWNAMIDAALKEGE